MEPFALRMAQELGRRRFRVVRVHPDAKNPVGKDWPLRATDDVAVLEKQFAVGEFNIGVACGPQPNDINLVVIDVDVRQDGLANWARLVAEHGGIPDTVVHCTPSGGLHVFFDAGGADIRNSANQIVPGVDVRGAGGQVVHPPSWRMVDGEKRWYTEQVKGGGLWRRSAVVAPMPLWLVELCVKLMRVPVERAAASPVLGGELSNPEWLRDHWDWVAVLEGQGHTMVRQAGEQVFMRHPQATSDHSAVVHLRTNMMNAFSTNMPRHPRGLSNADGSVPWSPYDWFVATECRYDTKLADRELNRRRGRADLGVRATPQADSTGHPGQSASAVGATVSTDFFLPDAFWESTPLLRAVYAAALQRLLTPDAVLNVLLSMYATTIPMNVWLPPTVAAPAPLNMYGVLTATSGGGKTGAMRLAGELLGPLANRDIRLRQGLRSGEGIITKVLKPSKKSPDGEVERAHYVGVHFHYDEGGTLSKQSNQTASTIMPYLNTCWSGSGMVGGARADSDVGFEASQVRICATIGVQYGIGANLFSGEAQLLGFPQRILFCRSDGHPEVQNQEMPDEPSIFDPLGMPMLEHHEFPRPYLMPLPRPVRAEVWEWSKQTPEPYESHAMNLRLRVAAILMLMHGAPEDSFADWWSLSDPILQAHRDVRHSLVDSFSTLAAQRQASLGIGDSQRRASAFEYDLGRGVTSLMTKISGGQVFALRVLKDHFKSWKKRYQFDHRDVIERAILLGLVEEVEGGIRKV